MSGRYGTIDFAARTAQLNEVVTLGAHEHIYRVIELVGTSEKSIEDAISSAIARADKTLRNVRWFEVARTSGHVVDGGGPLSGDAEGRIYDGRAALTAEAIRPLRRLSPAINGPETGRARPGTRSCGG